MNKQALLDQIAADIVKNNVCPDLAKQATQLVFGDGNPDADLLFIGEAPGKREDEQGLPFVGASGKFLAEMLESIHLSRAQVYITNIVKYRPPKNRDPSPSEKQEFLPYLIRQIDVIKPKLIITLGRHSGMQFLPDILISRDHGQPTKISIVLPGSEVGDERTSRVRGDDEKRTEPYDMYGEGASESATKQSAVKHGSRTGLASQEAVMTLVILPLYHPAAALYNGGQRQTLLDDFALIPTILEKIRNDK